MPLEVVGLRASCLSECMKSHSSIVKPEVMVCRYLSLFVLYINIEIGNIDIKS